MPPLHKGAGRIKQGKIYWKHPAQHLLHRILPKESWQNNTFKRIPIQSKKSILSTSKSFAFPAISLEEEEHCLHTVPVPSLLLQLGLQWGRGRWVQHQCSCALHNTARGSPSNGGRAVTSCSELPARWAPRDKAPCASQGQIREALVPPCPLTLQIQS